MTRRLLWLLPFAAVAALVLATRPGTATLPPSTASAAAVTAGDTTPLITSVGTGQVDGTPDLLTVVLGVETRSASSQAALKDNANRANALIATLKSHGVAAADIATSQLSISPTYTNDGSHITGYSVSNTVTAKIHDLANAGSVIDAAAAAAGDAIRVQQISFSIDDDSSLLAAARADAVRRAHDQAAQMASAAGVHLGRLRSLSETTTTPPPYQPFQGAAAAAPGAPSPILPGTQQLTVTVTAQYEIEQ